MEAVAALMTEAEARACVSAINNHMDGARTKLLELYELEGWRVLGYASWRECCALEFGRSVSWLYRQLAAARIERDFSPMGEKLPLLPERRLRVIARADPEARHAMMELATSGASSRDLATSVSAVASERPAVQATARPASVVYTDQEALGVLLGIHARSSARILDVTFNQGRMWQGLPHDPHRLDREPDLYELGCTDTVADFRALPFEPESWDVLVFDPPHITDAGRTGLIGENQRGGWADRYGTLSEGFSGPSITPVFEPFLREADRVLVAGGIVLAKIADQVHNGRYQWQHVDLLVAARSAGFTPCDCLVKVSMSRSGLIDPRWRHVWHVRNVHTFWLVLRKGAACCVADARVARALEEVSCHEP